ncbi:MAG: neutral/alkaline non-lysosomal ceramidase N-terminal domain-containing protein, partial [Pirellulales bacterium]
MRLLEVNAALWRRFVLVVVVALGLQGATDAAEKDESLNYLVGRSRTDVTGPVLGVPMFGFVRADQITEGIHLRQYCRTFVIVDPQSEHRLALSVVDMGSVTYELWHEVLDRLQEKYGDVYRR